MSSQIERSNSDHAQGEVLEATSLANKMATARLNLVREFECHQGLTREQALARVREFDTPEFAKLLLRQPNQSTTWQHLDSLTAVDPALAAARWKDVVNDALDEVESGHRAAAAVEVTASSCWARAQFLALRAQLSAEWSPRNGIEIALLDSMAQALSLKMFWMGRMLSLDALENPEHEFANVSQLPRVDFFRAVDQAAAMADRFDRMFMRALRQLRDLRRYTVVVQQATQVNVGDQQVNVTG